VAIMQPYLLPYIGYFQLVAAVDLFIVYDNVKYTKKGWINRNRMLVDGGDAVFTVPLKHDADCLDVVQREVAATFDPEKVLRRLEAAYRRAPHFEDTIELVEEVLRCPERNLFRFLLHSLTTTCLHLGIGTELRPSSTVAADHDLSGQDRVLAICEATGAGVYVNAIGGTQLYDRQAFLERGVALFFLQSEPFEYRQFGDTFVPWLSIVDVLMFNPLDAVRDRLEGGYALV
jgi:hypothetical protein